VLKAPFLFLQTHALAISLVWGLVVLVLSLSPGNSHSSVLFFQGADKIVHLAIYLLWGFFFFQVAQQPLYYPFIVLFFLLFFGVLMEIGQYFIPYRSFEWYDIVANSTGAVASLYFFDRK